MNNKRMRNQVANAAAEAAKPQGQQQVLLQQTAYQGQIPPPGLLAEFDQLVPGTAARLIDWAEQEQQHRRALEISAQEANIVAQRKQLATAEYQTRAVFRSDICGQILGFIVCISCAGAAFWLGMQGHTAATIPRRPSRWQRSPPQR